MACVHDFCATQPSTDILKAKKGLCFAKKRNAPAQVASGYCPVSMTVIRETRLRTARIRSDPVVVRKQRDAKETMKRLTTIIVAALALSAWALPAADVAALYEKHCLKCHGADGKGETKMGKKVGARDLTDAKVQAELKDDAAFKAIKEGLKDKEGKVQMKPIEGATDEEIKALVAHVRTFKK